MKPQYPTARHFEYWSPVYISSVGGIDIYVTTTVSGGMIGFQENIDGRMRAWWCYNACADREWNYLRPKNGSPPFNPKHTKQAMEVGMAALNLML